MAFSMKSISELTRLLPQIRTNLEFQLLLGYYSYFREPEVSGGIGCFRHIAHQGPIL